MKRKTLEYLICPACLPGENALHLKDAGEQGDEITEGDLECPLCGRCYPVRSGVARVVLPPRGRPDELPLHNQSPDWLSAYLWSHYADLFEDPDILPSYGQWAEQITCKGGVGLDLGCSVGRFSFEMASKCDFVIGMDRSETFIYMAREILLSRKLAFRVKDEGCINSARSFSIPDAWDSQKIDFIVSDVHRLPFRRDVFSAVTSLNLVDIVPRPLEHLKEMNRVARAETSQVLISDPFTWREKFSMPEHWLGGTAENPGFALDNISNLLCGADGLMTPHWTITERGAVWWKIRHHRNLFLLIRSLFIKAER